MERITVTLFAVIATSSVYADRFGLNEPEDYDYGYGSGGGTDPLGFLMVLGCTIAAYLYLGKVYLEHEERKSEGEKLAYPDEAFDWVVFIVVSLVVSIFLLLPLLLILKWTVGAWFVREFWFWMYLPAVGVFMYLQRN